MFEGMFDGTVVSLILWPLAVYVRRYVVLTSENLSRTLS